MPPQININLRGFSLVELTVVLLLITLLANVAVRSSSELAFEARFQQTQERLELIKQAILGNPKQVVNGQQAISGFVADMGRLPISMRELFSLDPYCYDPTYAVDVSNDASYGTQALCEAAGYTWHIVTGPNNPSANPANLKAGWRGPYLSISDNPTNKTAYTDGWGRQGDSLNYGWRFEQGLNIANLGDANPANDQVDPDGVVRLIIQSFGRDQNQNNTLPTNDYIDDFLKGLFGK